MNVVILRLLFAGRIWLQMANYKSEEVKAPPNRFVDNWLYMQEFTLELQPATPAHIAGDVTHLLVSWQRLLCQFPFREKLGLY